MHSMTVSGPAAARAPRPMSSVIACVVFGLMTSNEGMRRSLSVVVSGRCGSEDARGGRAREDLFGDALLGELVTRELERDLAAGQDEDAVAQPRELLVVRAGADDGGAAGGGGT